MRRNIKKGLSMLLASAVVLGNMPAIGTVTAHATDGIAISATNFPDSTFMNYVKEFDTDSNGELSPEEIDKVTDIRVTNKGITDLKGIEHFTKLETLDCSMNKLTSLDISSNTELIEFNCAYNSISLLDVSKNTALTTFYCYNNKLISLDVSKNTVLYTLYCANNKLTSLDVGKNTALGELYCSDNMLTSLDVSNFCVMFDKVVESIYNVLNKRTES